MGMWLVSRNFFLTGSRHETSYFWTRRFFGKCFLSVLTGTEEYFCLWALSWLLGWVAALPESILEDTTWHRKRSFVRMENSKHLKSNQVKLINMSRNLYGLHSRWLTRCQSKRTVNYLLFQDLSSTNPAGDVPTIPFNNSNVTVISDDSIYSLVVTVYRRSRKYIYNLPQ